MVRRMTSPVLVGRSEVVGQLDAALEATIRGEPRHAVIGGEAGVGKTRLLAESRALAQERGAKVLLGGCVSMGTEGLPFAPYTEMIRSLVAQEGAAKVAALAGRAAPDLARLVPALDTGKAALDQELWAQTRLYEALLDLFRRLAEKAPLVIQLEDLHWADAGTLAATSYLLRAIHDEPIAVMATFRIDEVTRKHPLRSWLAEAVRDAKVERIELAPLDEAGVASLIEHILGEGLGQRDVEVIHRRSDGNPFFVEELLCCRTDVSDALPASLRDVLLSRIDALSESSQRLIGVAAVGGREVEHEILVSVAGDEAATAADLRVLVDAGLLTPTRAVDDDDAYSFRHALLHEVVYDAMLPTERRRLHRRWGEYLSEHGEGASAGAADLVQLAYHWREARDPRALAACIAAGDGAMETFSYEIATGEYEAALLLWDETAEVGIDHVELLQRTGRTAYLASEFRRAIAACREAIDELGSSDLARLVELRTLLARAMWVAGDWAASIEQYEEALRIAPADPPRVRIRALAGLGQVYMLHARLREARPLLEEAIESARAIGARDLEGHGLNSLAVVLVGLGETAAGNEAIGTALDIALELGIPDDIGRAHVNRAEIENWSGDAAGALGSSLEGLRVAAEWGVANSYGAYIAYGAVSFAFECGQWDVARQLMADADRLTGPTEGTLVYRASYMMEFLACAGDPEFEGLWERVLPLLTVRPASDNHGLIYQAAAEHLAFAGDYARALEVAHEGVDNSVGLDVGWRRGEIARVAAWPQAEIGRSARAAGDAAAASDAAAGMERLVELAGQRRKDVAHPSPQLSRVMELNVDQVNAERARMNGIECVDDWGAVAAGWTEIGRPFRAAMARWRQAQAAEDAGARDRAVAALRQSHDTATALGAKPLVAQLDAMARRLRVRLGAPSTSAASAPGNAYGLTRREREVLTEVAAGRTNREIAANLFISESTAGVHVSNILGKLGVSTRTEAARVALDQGLVGG